MQNGAVRSSKISHGERDLIRLMARAGQILAFLLYTHNRLLLSVVFMQLYVAKHEALLQGGYAVANRNGGFIKALKRAFPELLFKASWMRGNGEKRKKMESLRPQLQTKASSRTL